MTVLKILFANLLNRTPLEVKEYGNLSRPYNLFLLNTGDCGGCALELSGLMGSAYGVKGLGIQSVAVPQRADFLLVSGCVSKNMIPVIKAVWAEMPYAKGIIALGQCAIDGGESFFRNYAVMGGTKDWMETVLTIPGCPPSPLEILEKLMALLEFVDYHQALPAGPLHPASGEDSSSS